MLKRIAFNIRRIEYDIYDTNHAPIFDILHDHLDEFEAWSRSYRAQAEQGLLTPAQEAAVRPRIYRLHTSTRAIKLYLDDFAARRIMQRGLWWMGLPEYRKHAVLLDRLEWAREQCRILELIVPRIGE